MLGLDLYVDFNMLGLGEIESDTNDSVLLTEIDDIFDAIDIGFIDFDGFFDLIYDDLNASGTSAFKLDISP